MSHDPCVNCPADTEPRLLLCLTCTAVIDDTMLDNLIGKYRTLPEWLARAQQRLESEPRGGERYQTGLKRWKRQIRVYERLGVFLVGALALRTEYREVQATPWTAIGPGLDAWQRFCEVQMTLEPRSPLVTAVVEALAVEVGE